MLHIRRQQDVAGHRFGREPREFDSIGELLEALALDGRLGVRAADDFRCDKRMHLVDKAREKKKKSNAAAAFDENGRDFTFAKRLHQDAQVDF